MVELTTLNCVVAVHAVAPSKKPMQEKIRKFLLKIIQNFLFEFIINSSIITDFVILAISNPLYPWQWENGVGIVSIDTVFSFHL